MDLFLTFLLNRFTQLTIRALTFLCAALFGADAVKSPDASSAIQQGAGWLLAGLVSFLLDLAIHSAVYGRFKAWWRQYTAGSVMLLLIAASVALAIFSGCAQNERNRAAQGMIAVQTHYKNADDLLNAGELTEAQARALKQLIDAERDAVNGYYDAIRSGDSETLAQAKAALAAAKSAAAKEFAKYGIIDTTPITLPTITTQPAK